MMLEEAMGKSANSSLVASLPVKMITAKNIFFFQVFR